MEQWTAVSPARILSIAVDDKATDQAALTVRVRGRQGEQVTLAFAPPLDEASRVQPSQIRAHALTCTIGSQEEARARCLQGQGLRQVQAQGSEACHCVVDE